MVSRIARWFDDRLGAAREGTSALDKVFPRHWSFLLGEVALYSFVLLVLTGVFLTFFFDPGSADVLYKGSYEPLRGVTMSEAYRSSIELSFDVPAGLLFRQVHHWSALVFVAAIVTHLARVFFTGAFRRPREINWLIGVTMLLLALANGFTGYSLLDDLLSGTGLRIAYSVALSIPIVGPWLAFGFFGGEFPADGMIGRLFIVHILLVPVALGILLAGHLGILWHQVHTQFPEPGADERTVKGERLWPRYAFKSLGLFGLVAGVLFLLGSLAQINPVWLYGPYEPSTVTTAAQPDWYVGFLEGALRLAPPWDLTLFGHTVPELFLPGVVLPGLTFALLYAWPFLERRVTGDREPHNILDRPRDRPVRTALGVATISFYVVLTLAGGQDVIAQWLHVDVGTVRAWLRGLVLVVPVAAGLLTHRLCRELAAADPLPPPDQEGTEPADDGPDGDERAPGRPGSDEGAAPSDEGRGDGDDPATEVAASPSPAASS